MGTAASGEGRGVGMKEGAGPEGGREAALERWVREGAVEGGGEPAAGIRTPLARAAESSLRRRRAPERTRRLGSLAR